MSANCPHIQDLAKLSPPRLADSVSREECTQCFDTQDTEQGIDVCLSCFNGGCLSSDRHHARTHVEKWNHPFTLNVKRKLKPQAKRNDDEPPAKMAKLAIVEERPEDKYDHVTALKCWKCDPKDGREVMGVPEPLAKSLTDGIMQSMSSGRQSEVQAWEEEITACEHTLTLQQQSVAPIEASGLAHCSQCDLKENLWLCLTCGSLGCGRQMYGGIGGNGHGLKHYEETQHPVCVKLGTITPEGSADIYCYSCNETRLDPELAYHLSTFGINVQTQSKTEKSMTELQLEYNLKYDFSLMGEDGQALQPVFGPGLTGMANLGNSCYMASAIQALFSLPAFAERYLPTAETHWLTCSERLPASCLDCQMHKLADGLLSGRYSKPTTSANAAPVDPNSVQQESSTSVFQDGIKPVSFKALIGKGHEEFSTMRQQDSEEFLTHLIKVLRQHAKKIGADINKEPTEIFKFGMEQRLQCGDCKRVRYRIDSQDVVSVPIPARINEQDKDGKDEYEGVNISEPLEMISSDEALEYQCPSCQKRVIATKRTRFATFPDVLVIHAKKFQLLNWVPAKLDIPVILPPDDILELDQYIGHGLQDGETQLPEDAAAAPALPTFNEAAMAQLEGMGFPVVRCQKALLATGNNDPEAAMEWLFAHMEDPDIDAPIQPGGAVASGPEPSTEQIGMLSDMGFTAPQAKKALRETGGNMERAIEWLFNHPDDTGEDTPPTAAGSSHPAQVNPGGSPTLPARYKLKAFISHKGPSVHSGHYVAHVKFEDGWILFNDEKVVKADAESINQLKPLAYLYIFERV